MTRTTIIAIMLTCPVIGLMLCVYFGGHLRRFLKETPQIKSPKDIERFEQLVKGQMYAALAQIVILSIPILVFAYGLFIKLLKPNTDILYMLAPSLIVLAAGMILKKTEHTVQHIPTANDELAKERDRIVEIWQHQALPNW